MLEPSAFDLIFVLCGYFLRNTIISMSDYIENVKSVKLFDIIYYKYFGHNIP